MGASRTSNKDLLNAINGLGDQIVAGIAAAMTQNAAPAADVPVLTDAVEPTPEPEPQQDTVQIPASYKAHVMAKVQDKCDSDGEDRILYARKNLAGETKLAYCLASRWTSLKDNGLIGAVAHVKPA